jgi:hypothetical protein
MLETLFDLAKDVVDVADAVVSVPVTLVRGATKPIAELAKELREEVRDIIDYVCSPKPAMGWPPGGVRRA